MKIAVLGGTGRTGLLVIAEALGRGHEVAALVRDPARLGDLADRTRVVTADVRDPAALPTLVAGTDAVVSALGPVGKDSRLHQDTAAALITAMREHGVRRFVGTSGAGVSIPGDDKSGRDRTITWLMQRFGGSAVTDKQSESAMWAASGLDWTLVRPPRLVDGPPTGALEHDAHRSAAATKLRRADLAAFLVDLAEGDRYVGEAPLVAERP